MSSADGPAVTAPISDGGRPSLVRRFELVVLEGAAAGTTWASASDRCSIGSHPSNDLMITDPTVSRFHCEVTIAAGRARVRDLGSRNGTLVDGVEAVEAILRVGSLLRLGRSTIRFGLGSDDNQLALSERTRFGPLVGGSIAMRSIFAILERAAATDSTVLLEGETGTGKEVTAHAIHEESARRDGPLVVVDCSAIPANLLESELFGHERGSFTGATERRIGAFEEADGGTLFLDELGELPLDLQPKLLRALERREVRRLGASRAVSVNFRVIAATNRDLRVEVNAGRFRPDLYYRLAVIKVALPSLRSRPEDLPLLVDELLRSLGASAAASATLRAPDFLARIAGAAWPGNVRELRNYLERCLVYQQPMPLVEAGAPPAAATPVPMSWVYADARRQALDQFERDYVHQLVARHSGKVASAAREAGVNRVYLYRLLKRHGLNPG